MATVYDFIAQNNRRVFLLSFVFCVLVLLCTWGVAYSFGMAHYSHPPDGSDNYVDYIGKSIARKVIDAIFSGKNYEAPDIEWVSEDLYPKVRNFAWRTTAVVFLVLMCFLISPPRFLQSMVLNSSHAQRMQEAQYRELYRLAGTMFKTAGLPPPKLYIIEDNSLNAFTTGFSPANSALVVTRGLLNNLSNPELEAVLAHEAAHVACKDCKLMLTAVSSVLLFSFLAEVSFVSVFYGARRNIFAAAVIWCIGAVCAFLGFVAAPLGRLAISRGCEDRADALAAWICRNPQALASALRKIEKDPYVEILDNHPSMVGMCIANPRRETNFFLEVTGFWKTHPPISMRVRALEEMADTKIA